MKIFQRKQDKWLLVFAGCHTYEAEIVGRCLSKAGELINRSIPAYETRTIPRGQTMKIALSIRNAANDLSESINEFILNDVIKWKNACAATQTAVILPATAFTHKDTFFRVLSDLIFQESNYHAVCVNGDFLDSTVRKTCMGTVCTQCGKLAADCQHSCLLWLIWMMYGHRDARIYNLFDHWKPE